MKTVKIKNMEIGKGMPKICVPITGKNRAEILEELKEIKEQKPELAEWRVDCYDEGAEDEKNWEMLKTISDSLEQIPLLFTFRTAKEGGNREITFEDYVKLLKKAARTGMADIIDVEAFFEEAQTKELIEALKAENVKVLASNHHFHRTPAAEEIEDRMKRMDQYGADILKMAVMPSDTRDLITLLEATVKVGERSQKPVVTMSMGKTGVLSRICGEITGSCITFAAGKKASAPGQIQVRKMKELLEEIHCLQTEEN